MMRKTNGKEYKLIYILIVFMFCVFLAYPMVSLLGKSFIKDGSFTMIQYQEIFQTNEFLSALQNSFQVSLSSSLCALLLAFLLAYTINYTNTFIWIKKVITLISSMPMLLPTITYGFAIIYSFGKQGLLTKLLGVQLLNVYGFNGIFIGYVIYTLPIAFMLMNNAMQQIDKKYMIVSRLMQDHAGRQFVMTILRPLLGTFTACMIQCFFLAFTDFGIPASVGGKYHVIASLLYSYMLGSIPDFAKGAVIAMVMLVPSIVSILWMRYLQKFQIRYHQINDIVLKQNRLRDIGCSIASLIVCCSVLSIFGVIFLLPFVKQWPYDISFTFDHIRSVFSDHQLLQVLKNTIVMALFTAIVGTVLAFGAALVSERSNLSSKWKQSVESLALITNTIPGMVIGISYLFIFSGTPLQNTLVLLVICNLVHFFSTPYLMMKETLSKMNASFETTAKLMGDSWFQTVIRVITPNARSSLIEVFSYYFINATVTVSAIIFIAGAKTMVITTKIKELQYFAKFNEVFVLSLLLFACNLFVKYSCTKLAQKGKEK